MADTFDVIVIGAGSTGTNAAWYARDNGLTCAVVEDRLVGGECSYWACIPSKALLGPPAALEAARRLPGAAEAVTGGIDTGAVLARRDELIHGLDDAGQVSWIEGIDAELVRGRGRITGERTVEVTGHDSSTTTLRARRAVVVATGSRASLPPVEGLAEIAPWGNHEVTTASAIPERLLVLGGGVAGCEMAQAYRRLGASSVTILERSGRILGPYDPWVSEIVAAAFDDDGIRIRRDTSVERADRQGTDGPVTLTLDDRSTITGDELLVAAGRTPNTDDIGLDSVGLEPGGPLEVDDHLRVSGVDGGWLYAAGDVNGRAQLTHQGKYQARLVGDTIAGREGEAWADHRAVPQVVFTDPEIASVGTTAEEAATSDLDTRVVHVDLDSVAGAALHGATTGRAQLVIDETRRVVVGATFVGSGVGELLHAATIAVVGEVPIDRLWHAVPAFPTLSEVWLRLLEADRGL